MALAFSFLNPKKAGLCRYQKISLLLVEILFFIIFIVKTFELGISSVWALRVNKDFQPAQGLLNVRVRKKIYSKNIFYILSGGPRLFFLWENFFLFLPILLTSFSSSTEKKPLRLLKKFFSLAKKFFFV